MRRFLADTRPLRNADYARLFKASIITNIGAQVTVIVVPAQLYAQTGSSSMVGLAGLFGLVPLVIFGLYGGALADVFDRRTLMVASTFGLSVTVALMAWQAFAGNENPWVLLSLFSVQQAFFGISGPTRSAIIPRLIPRDQLVSANALNMTVFTAAAIVGPTVGGALIPVLGYGWLYSLDAVTMLATVWAAWKLPPLPIEGQVTKGKAPGLKSVIDGVLFAARNPVLAMSLIIDLIAMIFGMPRAVFPQVASEVFGDPVEGGIAFGILMASMPAGAALGGVFSGWTARVTRQGFAVLASVMIWGAGISITGAAIMAAESFGPASAVSVWLFVAVVGMAIGGTADMVSAAFRTAILQDAVDDDLRGRLQGLFLVVVAGGPRIADIIHGYGADHIGPGLTVLVGGVLVMILTVATAVLSPTFRTYTVEDAPTGRT